MATKKYEVGGMTEAESCGKPGKPRCKKTFKSKGKSKETKGSLLGTIGAGLLGGLGGYAAYKKLKEQKKGGATKYQKGGSAPHGPGSMTHGTVPPMMAKPDSEKTPKEKRQAKRELKKTLKYVSKKGSGYNTPNAKKYQAGGAKKPLRKAQDGMTAGPFEEGTQKYLDAKYPGTAMKFTGPLDPEYMADQRDKVANPTRTGWARKSELEKADRMAEENQMRSPGWSDDFNTGMGLSEDNAYKRGGRVKKPRMQKGGILTPAGRIKSKKVRNLDLTGRQTTADVSRTKRDGTTVTKSVNTSRGFAPTATKTKTVTDKSGNVVSKDTKAMDYNRAVRKTKRVANNVGRNANDTYAYKKGGTMKKMKTGGMVNPNANLKATATAGSRGVKSGVNPKAAASKVARGRSGGISAAPKTAVPKAKYGMSITKMKRK